MKQLGNSINVIDRRKPLMIRKLLSLTIALALLLMPCLALAEDYQSYACLLYTSDAADE